MKRILCPTDFSKVADNAIVFAAKLSKRLNATLQLVNFQVLGDLTPEEALFGSDLNLSGARKTIDERAVEVTKAFKISCYGDVTPSVVQSIPTELAKEAPDYALVVMGTNGEDSFFQHLFGSNTYQFINKSETPILIVPESCEYREIKKMIYAFDYWRSDGLVLAKVVSFCESLGCELIILQIMETSFSIDAEDELKRIQKLILEAYGDRVSITFDVAHNNDIAGAINTYALQSKAELLTLCSPHHGWLGGMIHKSVVKSLVNKANYPVLVVDH